MSVNRRAVRALVVVSILVAACGGQPGAAPGPRPDAASPAAAVSRAPARAPRAPAPAAARLAVYRAKTSAIPAWSRRRMIGVSWHPGCPVGLGRLRLLTLSYWGFDHAVHRGQLIVNESAARALIRAFALLFAPSISTRSRTRRSWAAPSTRPPRPRGPTGRGTARR